MECQHLLQLSCIAINVEIIETKRWNNKFGSKIIGKSLDVTLDNPKVQYM